MVKRTILLFCLFLVPGFMIAEQTDARSVVSGWYRDNPRTETYRDIEDRLIALIDPGIRAGIPETLLLEILDEAVAKNIPSSTILEVFSQRLRELVSVKSALRQVHDCLERDLAFEEHATPIVLKKYALFLRQGITGTVLNEILKEACRLHKDYDSAVNTLRTLSAISSRGELSDRELIELGKAVLQSMLSPSSYTALSSFYVKAKLYNINSHDLTEIIISVLKEGKGLVRIEQELNRRGGL